MVFYKFSELDEWAINNLYYNIIYFSDFGNLNDSAEFSVRLYDDSSESKITKEDIKTRASGFIENLWGKKELDYIKSCRDKVDKSKEYFHVQDDLSDEEVMGVNYNKSNSIPRLNVSEVLALDNKRLIEKIALNKGKDWRYENEYRMIRDERVITLDEGKVKEVYFGYKSDIAKVMLARDVTLNKDPDVRFYVVLPNRVGYKMACLDVTNSDREGIESHLRFGSADSLSEKYVFDHAIAKRAEKMIKLDK